MHILYIINTHLYKTLRIMFTLNVNDLTFMSGGRGDGGGEVGWENCREYDKCSNSMKSVKLPAVLDIFSGDVRTSSAVFVATMQDDFNETSEHHLLCLRWKKTKNRYFNLFGTLTKWFLCRNPIRLEEQCCHNIKIVRDSRFSKSTIWFDLWL